MKGGGVGGGGGGGAGGSVSKKPWSGLVIGVLFLVFLSMMVPLAFLLGLHNGFYSSSGYLSGNQNHINDGIALTNTPNHHSKGGGEGKSSHMPDLVTRLPPKGVLTNASGEAKSGHILKSAAQENQEGKETDTQAGIHVVQQPLPASNISRRDSSVEVMERMKGGGDESRKACELKYGSYCLWREEHREELKDSMVKKLKDSLFVARAYYPTIAKLPTQDQLSRELKQNIQELERIFSESSTDADLPPQIEKKLENMLAAIEKAKKFPVDCNNVDKKLRQIFDMTEDEANFHMKQSAFLYQLAVQTMPKSLHCLSMRLTVEYFKSKVDKELSLAERYSDPTLQHYVIFSNNVLASSVVINSTVVNSRESGNLVFHVLTDRENYFAMKLWFFRNTYREATIEVLNVEDLDLQDPDMTTSLHLSLPLEFRLSSTSADDKMQYISIFSHLHYILTDVFKGLEKVVVLDHDVVVQRDLSALWTLNMEGKVNGAVEVCSLRLGQLKNFLGKSNFNINSCVWMSGLNVIDLGRWRELGLTESYKQFVRERQKVSKGEESMDSVTLHASLLTFQDQVYALDSETWALSGLGHDYGVDIGTIKKVAVLHYNGNMKPWLELGIPKYKKFWKKYLNQEDGFLSQCNV
ncbi:hypothetical protein ACFE04_003595 [Oxalis oulophora]